MQYQHVHEPSRVEAEIGRVRRPSCLFFSFLFFCLLAVAAGPDSDLDHSIGTRWIEWYGSNPPLILARCMHDDAPDSGAAGLSPLACFRAAEKKENPGLIISGCCLQTLKTGNLVSVEGFLVLCLSLELTTIGPPP